MFASLRSVLIQPRTSCTRSNLDGSGDFDETKANNVCCNIGVLTTRCKQLVKKYKFFKDYETQAEISICTCSTRFETFLKHGVRMCSRQDPKACFPVFLSTDLSALEKYVQRAMTQSQLFI